MIGDEGGSSIGAIDGPTLELRDDELTQLGEAGWLVRDAAFGAFTWRSALSEARLLRERGRLRLAGMGRSRERRPGTRGDLTCWLEPDSLEFDGSPGHRGLLRRFSELRDSLNAMAWLGLETFQVQLALYPGQGERYARHRDAFRGDIAARRLTAIYYLNENWTASDGGCLRLHLDPEPIDLPPLADRLVLLLSDRVEHEVLATFSERWAVTAWYHGPRAQPGT